MQDCFATNNWVPIDDFVARNDASEGQRVKKIISVQQPY